MRKLTLSIVAVLGIGSQFSCGASSPVCDTTGTGQLNVNIFGLPGGVNGAVDARAVGASAGMNVTSTTSLTLAAGFYAITADVVAGPADVIVRTAYAPTVGAGADNLCVPGGGVTAVSITYSSIPTSNKLWTTGGNGGAANMLGFASSTLTASGAPAATTKAATLPAKNYTFDHVGNLWALGGTVADPTLSRYPAAALATATPAADININIKNSGCSPLATGLAFDSSRNLWVSLLCENKVVRLTPADLATSREVTPAVAITAITAPKGLAFDSAGNLWVAHDDISQVLAASLATGGAVAQTIKLIAKDENKANAAAAASLAFDASGNLWAAVESNYNFAQIFSASLTGTGTRNLEPSTYISAGVNALVEQPAFDEAGGIWFAAAQGKFARLAPGQLSANSIYDGSQPAPAVTISSADVGYAGPIAFYPAPANLPLFHRLP